MKEIWKDIKGYEGRYRVSDQGRVKSLNYQRTGKARILRTAANAAYQSVGIGGKTVAVHRLVAEAFIPNPEGKTEVNHINCNTWDNRAVNLEWATPAENKAHYIKSEKRRGIMKALKRR